MYYYRIINWLQEHNIKMYSTFAWAPRIQLYEFGLVSLDLLSCVLVSGHMCSLNEHPQCQTPQAASHSSVILRCHMMTCESLTQHVQTFSH